MAVGLMEEMVQVCVALYNIFPLVISLGTLAGTDPILVNQFRRVQQLLQLPLQVGLAFGATVCHSGIANYLQIRRRVIHQYAIAVSHRLDQRRVRATNLVRKHEEVGILLKLGVAIAVHSSGKHYPWVARRFQGADIFFLPRIVAHDDQLSPGDRVLEGANKNVDIVFGNQAADK